MHRRVLGNARIRVYEILAIWRGFGTLRRDIGASDNALARVDDEVQLFRDMQNDLVNQLLRRLATVRPAQS